MEHFISGQYALNDPALLNAMLKQAKQFDLF